MATGPGHMALGRLGWQQGLDPWHQGGWDGNRTWPNDTKEAGMATEPGHMATGRLGWQQGRLYGYSARQHGTRVAGLATGSWQKHQGVWDCTRAWPNASREAEMETGYGQMAPERLEWQQGLATWHQGG